MYKIWIGEVSMDILGCCGSMVVLSMYGAHFIGSLKCAIYIHICWYLHVAHFMTPFNCTTSHYQHALNTTILPQHPSLQSLG